MKTLELVVTGMHCASCAELIGDALSDLGVTTHSFAGDKLKVSFDEKNLSKEKIVAAIRKEGYGVK
jgi:copper chaperone CopZ